jgi:hypothetical protein
MPVGVAGLPIRRKFELGRYLTGCTRRRCSLRRAVIAAVAIISLAIISTAICTPLISAVDASNAPRVLAVARYGLAHYPRTKTYLCLGIDEAI